jgi:hypothetical protein
MNNDRPNNERRPEPLMRRPILIALVVTIFGMLAMLIVDHGPWSAAKVQSVEVADHQTTGAAARAAGAVVTPTAPKSTIEPAAPGPNPAQSVNPVTP